MSRELVASLFISMDGIVSDPFLFQYDSFDDDLGVFMTDAIGQVDDVVLGRVTYEQWSAYWQDGFPEEDRSFADFINPTPKHVASRTLSQDDLTWQNSHLIEGDLVEALRALKQGDGRQIAVNGSVSVVQQLAKAGELDRLTLVQHPATQGEGVRLFEGFGRQRFDLLDLQRTERGNVLMTYGPKKS